MENLELNKCKFVLGRYAYDENDIKNGLKPAPHRALRDCYSLYLELKDCRISTVKALYSLIKKDLENRIKSIELADSEQKEYEIHFTDYFIVDAFKNIIKKMESDEEFNQFI